MRLSNDNSTWSDWGAYNFSASWTMLPGDGLITAYVQFVDNAGLVSGTYSVNVTLDTRIQWLKMYRGFLRAWFNPCNE